MNFVDLFSGIGGFRLAAQWAGFEFEHEFHSDIDEYANKVYAKHFPQSVQLGDITKIDWNEVKKHKGEWIVTGGFPCQDISIAGKGAGLAGARSGLWFEMQKAISILRPRFVIAENVGALTFRGLDAILASLAEIGYDVEWQDIRASDVGAPHRRERIWLIAYSNSEYGFGRCKSQFSGGSGRQTRNKFSGGDPTAKHPPNNSAIDELLTPDLHNAGLRGHGQNGERTGEWLTRSGAWQESWHEAAARLCIVDDGISNRVAQFRCLGNSIVPQVAQILFECIKPHIYSSDNGAKIP